MRNFCRKYDLERTVLVRHNDSGFTTFGLELVLGMSTFLLLIVSYIILSVNLSGTEFDSYKDKYNVDYVVNMAESALQDFGELLHIDKFSPEDTEVILDSLSGSKDKVLRKRLDGKDMVSLLTAEIDESSVDFEEVNKKFDYFREDYVSIVNALSRNTVQKNDFRNKDTKVSCKGKTYVGEDAYNLVKGLIDGRLP